MDVGAGAKPMSSGTSRGHGVSLAPKLFSDKTHDLLSVNV